MAAIKCPKCGKYISPKAKQCPYCKSILSDDAPDKVNTPSDSSITNSDGNEKPAYTKSQNVNNGNRPAPSAAPIKQRQQIDVGAAVEHQNIVKSINRTAPAENVTASKAAESPSNISVAPKTVEKENPAGHVNQPQAPLDTANDGPDDDFIQDDDFRKLMMQSAKKESSSPLSSAKAERPSSVKVDDTDKLAFEDPDDDVAPDNANDEFSDEDEPVDDSASDEDEYEDTGNEEVSEDEYEDDDTADDDSSDEEYDPNYDHYYDDVLPEKQAERDLIDKDFLARVFIVAVSAVLAVVVMAYRLV